MDDMRRPLAAKMTARMFAKHPHLRWLVGRPRLRAAYRFIEWGLPMIGVLLLAGCAWPMWTLYELCCRRMDYLQNSLEGFDLMFDPDNRLE